jgi:hypothetical protein
MIPAAPSCPGYQDRGDFEYFQKNKDNEIKERYVVSGEEEPSVKYNSSKNCQSALKNQRRPM